MKLLTYLNLLGRQRMLDLLNNFYGKSEKKNVDSIDDRIERL